MCAPFHLTVYSIVALRSIYGINVVNIGCQYCLQPIKRRPPLHNTPQAIRLDPFSAHLISANARLIMTPQREHVCTLKRVHADQITPEADVRCVKSFVRVEG